MPSAPAPFGVLIVADDPYARAGLAAKVADLGIDVADQVEPPHDGETLSVAGADVLLWDLGHFALDDEMPDLTVWDPVFVLALTDDEQVASKALAAGARGVLSRMADDRLAAAVEAVGAGLHVIDPVFAALLDRSQEDAEDPPFVSESLTPRESQVLALMADGLSNREIGERLEVSPHTAKFHVAAILDKLGAETRTEAVVLAVRWGLLHL